VCACFSNKTHKKRIKTTLHLLYLEDEGPRHPHLPLLLRRHFLSVLHHPHVGVPDQLPHRARAADADVDGVDADQGGGLLFVVVVVGGGVVVVVVVVVGGGGGDGLGGGGGWGCWIKGVCVVSGVGWG
jgi:hypothetical protein